MFFANDEGNLDEDQLRILFNWTTEFKSKRLQKVKDPYARNLVSRLLMKDPSKRPDASHALAHPFLSGKRVARMIGEEAEYDIFLSYRVKSDLHHCELMYEMLTEKGLRVWWDKKCLQPGVDWEEGFCEGLIKSKAFVALLSRAGLQNFEGLTDSSFCDNVLLEYRLALELQSFNLLEAVFPVMIGDSSGDSSGDSTDPRACTYTNYYKSGCSPNCPDIVVMSVEEKLNEHLNNQGLGAPVGSNRTVKDTLQTLTTHQGGFIQGAGRDAFRDIVDSMYSMIKPDRSSSGIMNGNDKKLVLVNKSEVDFINRGFDILWSGISKINALTSDAAGIIDSLAQNSYSNMSKVTNKSNYFYLITSSYILSGRRSEICIFCSKQCCKCDECSSRVAQISCHW